MSSTTNLQLSVSDRALLAGDTPDLRPQLPEMTRLMQSNNPELAPGADEYLEGARPGDFVIPCDGDRILVKGESGFAFQPVALEQAFVEWAPDRGGFVAEHPIRPADAQWLDAGVPKQGLYRSNGNKIEQTIYCHMLIGDKCATSFAFRSTSLVIGRDFGDRAQRLKIAGEEIRGLVIGKWRMTSRLKQRGDYRWHLPRIELIGKLGDRDGPTLDEVRFAAQMRKSFKDGLPWAPEPPEPPAVETPLRPKMITTSGRQSAVCEPPMRGRYVPDGRTTKFHFKDAYTRRVHSTCFCSGLSRQMGP